MDLVSTSRPPRVAIHTLGCKVNQYESHWMAQQLEQAGYCITDGEAAPDIVLVNSCTVTAEADRKTRQLLRKCRRLHPKAFLVVTGCSAQVFPEQLEPLCDLVVGNGGKSSIVTLCQERPQRAPEGSFGAYWLQQELSSVLREVPGRTRAEVLVQEGCNVGCSYCKIIQARGTTLRSKPLSLVCQEVAGLVQNGYREIVLTGINLGLYRQNGVNLPGLLRSLLQLPGDFRLRLGSLNPNDADQELLAMFQHPRMCPHLHVSLQHVSNQVLERMHRPYTAEQVEALLCALRTANPLFSFTGDLIAGFPGESASDWDKVLHFFREFDFLKVHVFPFSPREGTRAFSLFPRVPKAVLRERIRSLQAVLGQSSQSFRAKHLGEPREVLVEGSFSAHRRGWFHGHDAFYVHHVFPALPGSEPLRSGAKIRVVPCSVEPSTLDRMVSKPCGST
ncbi:MAG TPA: tRNA (N(6)-L-threonylcarbamoyladenosine(37)-C(2))-methylthiotransferase MtaB [Thermotogota bacterium]|nr:tRNA (N(6)-L-threonylcarbamoyladenosine(37)-C(2))-methylthiotransferase MtaB [Thermotogota bacterium]HRW91714.1 tRNA (N(6)-L-threonylcarbamoyladenosine(37)-C(2))-methylthiotransferase MtaB [Thermotogota bacterium]